MFTDMLHEVSKEIFADTPSPEYWNVPSPHLDENKIMHMSASLYCVTLSAHAYIGLPYLQI
jgi:hypothetical protein